MFKILRYLRAKEWLLVAVAVGFLSCCPVLRERKAV